MSRSKQYRPGPLAMLNHPHTGRKAMRVRQEVVVIRLHGVWVPDDTHPLGGADGILVLYRRVNLRKDEISSWIRDRPLYEFTREVPLWRKTGSTPVSVSTAYTPANVKR